MKSVVIVQATRTPVGSFMGALAPLVASQLGAAVLKRAVAACGVDPAELAQVVMGNVLTSGQGQAPARQALIGAGLPVSVPALTINKVCGSGLKAVAVAAQDLMLGHGEAALAGGMESMSNAPYALPKARQGYRMSMPRGELLDLMVYDGLWDPYGQSHMGNLADKAARAQGFSREALDTFAAESFRRAQAAQAAGAFADEILPVAVPSGKTSVTVDTDEGPAKVKFEKIPTLKPVFSPDGVTTAANASSINDGAAALVLMTEERAARAGLEPLARIVGYAEASREPEWFTLAPERAIRRVLADTGLAVGDIDLFEINEAFAVVTLYAMRELGIPHEKVNVNGGAIALGHPIGASGARILTTLVHAMRRRSAKRGLATLCIGGGESVAMIVERV